MHAILMHSVVPCMHCERLFAECLRAALVSLRSWLTLYFFSRRPEATDGAHCARAQAHAQLRGGAAPDRDR